MSKITRTYQREYGCYVGVPDVHRPMLREQAEHRPERRDPCGYREGQALADGLRMVYGEEEC